MQTTATATSAISPRIRAAVAGVLVLLGLAVATSPAGAAVGDDPRERIRLDAGWRFHRGDPPGVDGRLDYDVRPVVVQSADGKVADARPDAAEKVERTRPVLKPWIPSVRGGHRPPLPPRPVRAA